MGICPDRARAAAAVVCAATALALLVAAPPATAFTGAPIPFGLLGPFTGFEADLGEAILQGAKTAQLAVNEAGGVLGRQLALVPSDTEGDAQDAEGAINYLLGPNHVVAVVGPETMEYYVVRPIFTQAQIPDFMQGGDTSLDHETDPYFWRDSPSDSVLTVAMALYAHKQGYTRAATMMLSERSAQDMKAPLAAAFTKLGGRIVADVTIAPGQTSYRSEVLRLIDARPQVVFTETDAVSAGILFSNFRQLGNPPIPFIGTDVTAGDDYLQAITYAAAHDRLTSLYGISEGSGRDTFERTYARLYPDREPLANANYAYDAVVVAALAIDQAASTAGPRINAGVTAVTSPSGTVCTDYAACLRLLGAGAKIKYEGASGSLVFNQYHNAFGRFGALRVDAKGHLQWVAVMSEEELAAAAP